VRRQQTILEIINAYVGIQRLPTSAGEQTVAESLAARYRALALDARVETCLATSSYALPIGLLSAIGAVAGALTGVNRWAAAALAFLTAAAIADDAAGGHRWFRRTAIPHKLAYNMVAEAGDPAARRTVVVLAHHDAAPSGVVFNQRPVRWIARRFPRFIAAAKTNPPTWWPVILAPLVVTAGALAGWGWLALAGSALCLLSVLAMVDIGRRVAVPGANDNLSGVAAQLCLAQALQVRPAPGLRLIFLSAGAEEALQEGIRGFAKRHFAEFGPHTWFINLESVGSGNLVLLEGEGPVRMRDYEASFKDLAAACAAEVGIPLIRGLRSRNSTDSEVPRRAGFPVATIVSLDADKLIPHYHLNSDTAENVDLTSVDDSARLAEAIIRCLAAPRR